MAEVDGLITRIAQIANAGIALSTALSDPAAGIGLAEQEIADIADDVKTAAIALDGVARLIGQGGKFNEVSDNAVSEANGLSKRCDAVFGEVQDFVDKRNELGQDGNKTSNAPEASQEQRVELLKRRLDHLKHSILLLLHVLRLANGQAQGTIENSVLNEERETIRDLHQRHQHSTKALQALESKLADALFSDEETLHGSTASSRVPTINFLLHSSARGVLQDGKVSGVDTSTTQAPSALADLSETSDSDDTVTDDDGEQLTVHDVAECANHVRKLLKRITVLQQFCENSHPHSDGRLPRNQILKMYRRFRRKFESELVVHENATSTTATTLPNLVSDPHRFQLVHTQDTVRDQQQQTQNASRIHSETFGAAADRTDPAQLQGSQNEVQPSRLVTEGHYAHTAPAWTISSEILGAGSRPKLPPLISTVPIASQVRSPANEIMSPSEDQDGKHSGTDGDVEHGSREAGPVVYTKTGRISKAKKGLKVHVCEECGRSFTRAEHLRRHQKNHGPNQVRCDLCGKVFFRADLLQRHLERHKDYPTNYRTDYRFSDASGPPTEGASPIAGDEANHQHILLAPGHAASGMPPHHSPSGKLVLSNGAPAPSGNPAPSPATVQVARPAWEPANAQPVAAYAREGNPTQRQHAWQTVNPPGPTQDSIGSVHASLPSPSSQQQVHPGLPKLQPRVAQPTAPTHGVPNHKRYSNILPALGAPTSQQQDRFHPQSHVPNMLAAQYGASPAQAASKGSNGPVAYYNPNYAGQGGPPLPSIRDGRIGQHQMGSQSPTLRALRFSPGNTPGTETFQQGSHERPGRPLRDDLRPSGDIDSGKFSSDKDGVNWRVAEADPQSYRQRKHNRTVSQTDADSSANDGVRGASFAHSTPDRTQRSQSASRSLSLVMPQDERDHALLGKGIRHDRRSTGAISPNGGPRLRTLSPALAEKRVSSRASTGLSDSYSAAGAHESESPEPESPYSLATINRYIKNQGPQPGVSQDEEMADQGALPQPTVHISTAPCERCREYSIKCDGRLPQCTACTTTKYAGECSFASMAALPIVPSGTLAEPLGTQAYDNITTVTRQAMAEPRQTTVPPQPSSDLHTDQGYNSDEDLPSPYLRPRDKAQQVESMAQSLAAPLDRDREALPGEKRKVGEQHMDAEADGKMHGRKKSKNDAEKTNANTNGRKDIVDMLLDQWSVPNA
ncbi:hypothetical protein BU23DRAFT_553908 [Bimuria novae-zelandiae CBS 107.79]|uniref:C2H2-type domain-containing protein n=1 Tax=Bimuria novae-zelandiae CBS 107.79 TaxID=1447943 RepID=A0A6A5VC57_9PLEO|nr:hypothetical protein BU23DRAFT_553908 [Bimuria novae-zelandiae CBS 107.79]